MCQTQHHSGDIFSVEALILGRNSFSAYSANVLDAHGTNVFTSAEPSMIKTSDAGSDSGKVTFFSRIPESCNFWQTCKFPPLLREAGKAWFSWQKNYFKSHSLFWQEINSLANSGQSSFTTISFVIGQDFSCTKNFNLVFLHGA